MNTAQPTPPICQSCAMPLQADDNFGSNADGSRNNEYCRYCYRDGQFTWRNATLDQFIEKLVDMSSKMEMTEEQARARATGVLPNLKRWAR